MLRRLGHLESPHLYLSVCECDPCQDSLTEGSPVILAGNLHCVFTESILGLPSEFSGRPAVKEGPKAARLAA